MFLLLILSAAAIVSSGVYLGCKRMAYAQYLSEQLQKVAALQALFDEMRLQQNKLYNEISVFSLGISKPNRDIYISHMEMNNQSMSMNVNARQSLVSELVKDLHKRPFKEMREHLRARARRISADQRYCGIVSNYIAKTKDCEKNGFVGFKAFTADLRSVDRELSDSQ